MTNLIGYYLLVLLLSDLLIQEDTKTTLISFSKASMRKIASQISPFAVYML